MFDYTIDNEDLQVLFLHTRDAYQGYTFEQWKRECKKAYTEFAIAKNNKGQDVPTYSQWVNGSIIALQQPL